MTESMQRDVKILSDPSRLWLPTACTDVGHVSAPCHGALHTSHPATVMGSGGVSASISHPCMHKHAVVCPFSRERWAGISAQPPTNTCAAGVHPVTSRAWPRLPPHAWTVIWPSPWGRSMCPRPCMATCVSLVLAPGTGWSTFPQHVNVHVSWAWSLPWGRSTFP